MSYTPTNWQSGDVVTSEKLNKIEQGIAAASGGGGIQVIHSDNGVLDKTYAEIVTAATNSFVYLDEVNETFHGIGNLVMYGSYDGTYSVAFSSTFAPGGIVQYETDSEDGYPHTEK